MFYRSTSATQHQYEDAHIHMLTPHLSQQGLDDAVHPCPCEHHVEVLRPGLVRRDVRDVHVGLLRAGELHSSSGCRVEQPVFYFILFFGIVFGVKFSFASE